ncbi:calcium-binding protein [Roseibium sp.]|uniref:calcium-binding protein n=1 Tax=Roseibium sp. TaxID=1936156 RepID=UPI00345B5E4F
MIDNERLFAGDGEDHVYGGAGHDEILGGAGDDRLFGNADNDFLVGGTGKDLVEGGDGIDTLSGGTANDVLTAVVKGDLPSNAGFVDDEEQDILDGGTGADTYLIHKAEHTIDVNSDTPVSYFDFIEGWTIHHQNQKGYAFDASLARFDTVDRIRDVDGTGVIEIQSSDNTSVILNKPNETFDHVSFEGRDFYVSENSEVAAFEKDGDLYVMHNAWSSEFGQNIDAYWTGYVATVIIEDFTDGDFNFDFSGTGNHGGNGDDTPNLSPRADGRGAFYNGYGGNDTMPATINSMAVRVMTILPVAAAMILFPVVKVRILFQAAVAMIS